MKLKILADAWHMFRSASLGGFRYPLVYLSSALIHPLEASTAFYNYVSTQVQITGNAKWLSFSIRLTDPSPDYKTMGKRSGITI